MLILCLCCIHSPGSGRQNQGSEVGHQPSVGMLVGSWVVRKVGFALLVAEMVVEMKAVVGGDVVVLCPAVVVLMLLMLLLSVVATGNAGVALISMLVAQVWFFV